MNKTDFAEELSKRTAIPRSKAMEITNTTLDILTEAMARKEKIQFIGFGNFETKYSPQRIARNPQTGEEAEIPAGYKPVFKASKVLRSKVNEG